MGQSNGSQRRAGGTYGKGGDAMVEILLGFGLHVRTLEGLEGRSSAAQQQRDSEEGQERPQPRQGWTGRHACLWLVAVAGRCFVHRGMDWDE